MLFAVAELLVKILPVTTASLLEHGVAERIRPNLYERVQKLAAMNFSHRLQETSRSLRRSRTRSRSRSIQASGLAERFSRYEQQAWITPPFYRIFWCLHNISLVATPISFGMYITRLYEGLSICEYIPYSSFTHPLFLSPFHSSPLSLPLPPLSPFILFVLSFPFSGPYP